MASETGTQKCIRKVNECLGCYAPCTSYWTKLMCSFIPQNSYSDLICHSVPGGWGSGEICYLHNMQNRFKFHHWKHRSAFIYSFAKLSSRVFHDYVLLLFCTVLRSLCILWGRLVIIFMEFIAGRLEVHLLSVQKTPTGSPKPSMLYID